MDITEGMEKFRFDSQGYDANGYNEEGLDREGHGEKIKTIVLGYDIDKKQKTLNIYNGNGIELYVAVDCDDYLIDIPNLTIYDRKLTQKEISGLEGIVSIN